MAGPLAVSLFSGAGGLDYGFEAAGVDIGTAVECDRDSCSTLRRRFGDRVIERDVFQVPTEEMLAVTGVAAGEIDLLIGGPPCQPFSKSGFWRTGDTERLEDPRAATLEAYLRVVEEAIPKVAFLENVAGLGYSGKSEGLDFLLSRLDAINRRIGTNYQCTCKVLNAANFGVPQHRQRFILIASRDGESFVMPQATHGEPDAMLVDYAEPYHTAFDAIGDINVDEGEDLQVRGKWADLLPSIPEGLNYLHHTDRGEGLPLFGWRRRFWSFLLKLSKSLPSWTIQAQPGPSVGPFHWHNRRLSIRELCRLQTIPDSVEIVGGRTSAQRQIGNAVPSLLGEVLAREICVQLLRSELPSTAPRLLPMRARETPPSESIAEVPARFLDLLGRHEPHPGTGLGAGALARAAQS